MQELNISAIVTHALKIQCKDQSDKKLLSFGKLIMLLFMCQKKKVQNLTTSNPPKHLNTYPLLIPILSLLLLFTDGYLQCLKNENSGENAGNIIWFHSKYSKSSPWRISLCFSIFCISGFSAVEIVHVADNSLCDTEPFWKMSVWQINEFPSWYSQFYLSQVS